MLKTILPLTCLILSLGANAGTWTLQDVAFADGAAATGSFDFDAGIYSNIDIQVAGGTHPTYSYIPSTFLDGDNQELLLIDLLEFSLGEFTVRALTFIFEGTLDSGASELDIDTLGGFSGDETQVCYNSSSGTSCLTGISSRDIIAGSVITEAAPVPVPATTGLFVTALLCLAVVKRRKA